MKKFLLFTLIIFSFTMLSIFVAEKTDVLGLGRHALNAYFEEADGKLVLAWERLPYPCFYKVEVFSHTTGLLENEPEAHLFHEEFTVNNNILLPSTAIPMYYKISAYGMFGRITSPSAPIPHPDFPQQPLAPVSIFHYTEKNKASLMPFLVWHTVPTAVCYELELLSAPPAQEGGIAPADKKILLESTRKIFTNGWQADLKKYAKHGVIYWRVRALGLHHEAIGEFSKAEPIHIDASLPQPQAPLINDFDQMPHFQQPVYPVYYWIPMHDIMRYEVELMIKPPAEPKGTQADPDRVWYKVVDSASTCYDEYARPYAGEYYWRVRAIDKSGQPLGPWSETAEFTVPQHDERVRTAVLGDSITHGGGAVSYPPCALEYSYTTYLDFPCLNIGRSGDTSHMTLERFDTDVLPLKPINLLVMTGSNSLRDKNITAERVISDLRSIRDKCEANDIRPIYLTLMPINGKNIAYAFHTDTDPNWHLKLNLINGWIKQQPYHIDLEPYFYDTAHKELDTGFSIDGLHTDIRGKMLMAEIINMHKDILK